MERKEEINQPLSPIFNEIELESIQDVNFKEFMTTFNERTKEEEEGGYDLKKSLLGVSDLLLEPNIGDPEERVGRQMNWLDTLKSRLFFTNTIRGPRFNARAIVDKNNVLLAISYLYNREQAYKEPTRITIASSEILLRSIKSWGEHSMAGYIRDLINTPLQERAARIGKQGREYSQRYAGGDSKLSEESQKENSLPLDERQKILADINIDWLNDKIKVVEKEIGNRLYFAHKNTPNWEALDIHPVVGEVAEYIRRSNIHQESRTPLSEASLENLREGLIVTLAYLKKYPFIPDASILEAKIIQASKKLSN